MKTTPISLILLALRMARWTAINGSDAEKRGEFARPQKKDDTTTGRKEV